MCNDWQWTSKKKYIKTFLTFTADIHELASWIKSFDVYHVAIESTGIYWKPIFNVFEGNFDIIFVNAQHVKNVPGRKTDVKDSEWLCKLLKCGLLTKSFIPPRDIVRLRELVRYRQTLTKDLTNAKNRIIKMLEEEEMMLNMDLKERELLNIFLQRVPKCLLRSLPLQLQKAKEHK